MNNFSCILHMRREKNNETPPENNLLTLRANEGVALPANVNLISHQQGNEMSIPAQL